PRLVELKTLSDNEYSWSDKQIFESLNKDLTIGLFENKKLIAVAIFSKIFDTAELLFICVDLSKHKKGFGFKLLTDSIYFL
ncbi:GNAT family N-acetyltransferase, partial [Francisella tularensis subsp. holarctica]